MEEPAHISPESASSSSTSNNGGPSGAATSSSSSSLPSSSHVQEEEHVQHQEHEQQQTSVSYHVNISISDIPSSGIRDDAWSCLVVLVTFWFFASMTLIMGFYGSVNLQLGPNCSRLLQANSLLVQYIKVQEVGESKTGPILYGFYGTPPLNVETTWSESHNASVPANVHKARRPFPTNRFFIYQIKFLILLQEWIYFLNEGSQLEISYSVKSQSSSPISLVIAQDRESLVEWIEDPLYPNTTLSWNIIHGKGTIQQEIYKSSSYYVALSNLNLEEVEGTPSDDWYVKLSLWTTMDLIFCWLRWETVLILLAFKFCNIINLPVEKELDSIRGWIAEEAGTCPICRRKDEEGEEDI
ncbi:hypothetical protein HHK36_032412 [Tetracentron sinense]|uniref:E3 ubiquitin-protein ligase APD1-4 N-terminal domain-containing protein n=1 Tax=Tetracentron sinense TaxID=13715 RepID=A0A834YAT7_TETSI|nr:hypothetical protein HHK36_032412 [Tetracentron sinense]